MKRLATAFLILLAAFTVRSESGAWKDGTYPGFANGYAGPLQVAVTIEKGKISKVEVVRQKEKRHRNALKTIASRIVRDQSTDVDAVSGATYSSKAVMSAVKNALEQAR